MRTLAICFAVLVGLATPAQAIVYDVNRTIGAGTVIGTITTDDTIGALAFGNITAWSFTITAPNLSGGPSVAISSGTAGHTLQVAPAGLGFTATPTAINFDFSAANVGALFSGNFSNPFWCIVGTGFGCTGGADQREAIGFNETGSILAQTVLRSGTQTIATAVSPVPIPAIFPIFAAVMGLFGFVGWRRRRKLAVA